MKKIIFSLILLFSMSNLLTGQSNLLSLSPKASFSLTGIAVNKNIFYVIVSAKLRDNWSIYWKSSGGVTEGTKFSKFKLPKGVTLEEISYSIPDYKINESKNFTQIVHLYKENATFLLKFKIDKKSSITKIIQGSFDITYQTCSQNICDFPKNKTLNFSVPIKPTSTDNLNSFMLKIKKRFPKKLPLNLEVIKDINKNILTLLVSQKEKINIADAYFFPNSKHIFEQKQNWHVNSQGLLEIIIPFPKDTEIKSEGVLKIITKSNKILSYQLDKLNEKATTHNISNNKSFFYYLLIAFIGGLILNIMPCVFPIIAIKILSFVNQAHKENSHPIKYALAFFSGVLISFWTLAFFIIISKLSGGENFIWGFQLQNPFFVTFLITLLVILSLNFFGIFEFSLPWTPQVKNSGLIGSFCSGLFATLIATPCVAPFMSLALVVALSLPIFQAWLIFTFLALGMSSPYLIFALFPNLLKWIPKPGQWMITFKKIMGFLLLASAIWLMETFANILTIKLLIQFALLLCLISLGFWYYGHQSNNKETKTYKLSLILLLINLTLCCHTMYSDIAYHRYLNNLTEKQRSQVISKNSILWQKFSPQKFLQLQKQKQKVFIDFTATWCASCLWNEKAILEPSHKLFKKYKVTMLKADCTKENHPFKKTLQQYKSTGIPLYLYFDGKKIHKLPSLLTKKIIKNILQK